jgi:four helix bundle protein
LQFETRKIDSIFFKISTMPFKFEKLEVWHESMAIADEIDQIVDSFPKKEIFNLSSQMRRAADSVSLNIAEGSTATSNTEQARFISISIRSCNEVVCCLYKAKRRNYLTEETFTIYYKRYDALVIKLQAFKKFLLSQKERELI